MLNERPQVVDCVPIGRSKFPKFVLRLRRGLHGQVAVGDLPGNIHEILNGAHDAGTQIKSHKARKQHYHNNADNERPFRLFILIGSRRTFLMDEILAAVNDTTELGRDIRVLAV